jgi:hypothetical protein
MIWHLSLSPQLVSDDDGHDFTHEYTKKEEEEGDSIAERRTRLLNS